MTKGYTTTGMLSPFHWEWHLKVQVDTLRRDLIDDDPDGRSLSVTGVFVPSLHINTHLLYHNWVQCEWGLCGVTSLLFAALVGRL